MCFRGLCWSHDCSCSSWPVVKEVVFKVVETCQNNKDLQIIRAQCLVQVSIGYVGKIFGSNVRVFWNLKKNKKATQPYEVAKSLEFVSGGELGIRTPDTLLAYTRLAGEHLRPLGQLSNTMRLVMITCPSLSCKEKSSAKSRFLRK